MGTGLTRRSVLRSAGVLGLASAAGLVRGDDKKPGGNYFGAGAFELHAPDALKPKAYSTNVSPDGLAFTVIFGSADVDALRVEVSGAMDTSAVKVATLSIPFVLPAGKRLAGFTQDVRGYVDKTKGTRVTAVADLGGRTELVDFGYDEEQPPGNFARSFFSLDRREGEKGAPAVYAINFFLTAQRRGTEDSALLVVDSLDVEAVLYGADTPKRTSTPHKKRPKKS